MELGVSLPPARLKQRGGTASSELMQAGCGSWTRLAAQRSVAVKHSGEPRTAHTMSTFCLLDEPTGLN